MAYQGLIKKYPVGRLLTEQDRSYQLKQDEQLEIEPHAGISVIKLNSTYLEIVDKFFSTKGAATVFCLFCILIVLGAAAYFWVVVPELQATTYKDDPQAPIVVAMAITVPAMIMAVGILRVMLKESFAYTHYPIRLNRKTRIVYVFRADGSVLTVPWGDLYFTLDYEQEVAGRAWENRAHVLEPDGETVRETFALGFNSSGDAEGMSILRSRWEFYRRYMDEGPPAVTKYVKYCMPVDGQREPFRAGYEVIFSNWEVLKSNPVLSILWLLMWPLNWLSVLGRWVAMQTSKIPQWPAEVEAANVVDPGDPYIKDARINPPDLR